MFIDRKQKKAKKLENQSQEIVEEYEASFNTVIKILDEIVKVFGDEKLTFEKYAKLLKISFSENCAILPRKEKQDAEKRTYPLPFCNPRGKWNPPLLFPAGGVGLRTAESPAALAGVCYFFHLEGLLQTVSEFVYLYAGDSTAGQTADHPP